MKTLHNLMTEIMAKQRADEVYSKFVTLFYAGVFDHKNSEITIHTDNDGNIRTVTIKEVAFKV